MTKILKHIEYTNTGYGLLYNWWGATHADKISSSDDWVVPAYTDLNYNTVGALFYNLGGAIALTGGLKEIGTTYWDSPNTGATNSYLFNGRGAGIRQSDTGGNYTALKITLQIHSTFTSGTDNRQYPICLYNEDTKSNFAGGWAPKKNGCSIRLLYTGAGTPTTYTGNDGKVYPVVLIGTQYWLAANLAETKYRNGDLIPFHGTDNNDNYTNSEWAALTTGALCAYGNDNANIGTITKSVKILKSSGKILKTT